MISLRFNTKNTDLTETLRKSPVQEIVCRLSKNYLRTLLQSIRPLISLFIKVKSCFADGDRLSQAKI